MGGRGSGRKASFGFFTDTCEDYLDIDIAWMQRRRMLVPGRAGSISWSRHGSHIASIGYVVQADSLRLNYRARSGGDDWCEICDFIAFAWTATNFGGKRQWFVCPGCEKRCRVIYGGALYRCRTCHGLRYESQYETSFSRACTQRHRLRKRLGQARSLEEPFPPKPKGMHWTTYETLKTRDEELERRWVTGIADWLERTKIDD
ncbi:MAG: hypothetical protein AAFR90_13760 [Pseudomonadota bacterium]